jgi:hypothetical protein
MRGRIPKKRDIQKTIFGILQSTAFLTTHAFGYSIVLCWLRKTFGGFNMLTAAFVPSFISSIAAIQIERPSRRNLLCLYVANVATESLWKMGTSRGIVKGIWRGQAIIFAISTSILIYYFRNGWHLNGNKDSIYGVARFIIGKDEEGGDKEIEKIETSEKVKKSRKINFRIIQQFLKLFNQLQNYLREFSKGEKCPHESSCAYYTLGGGAKLFSIGLGIQAALKLVLQIPKIVKTPGKVLRSIFSKDTLRIGAFLGGFSFLYRVS